MPERRDSKPPERRPRVACFATQGPGSGDERRIVQLLEAVQAELWPFDRTAKRASAAAIIRRARRERPDLLVMEGTGLAGGLACLLSGVPFVFSSGDAVAEYLGLRGALMGWLGARYERLLYRRCAGFIGWSPYLVGRAISFGARRAMTAAGWPDFDAGGDRGQARKALGISDDDIVVGIVGSLNWSPRAGYCYGLELVRAAAQVERDDLVVLIVGDGDGMPRLREAAAAVRGCRVLLTGRVSHDQVPGMLAAMDVASLPQSLDPVGALRLTIKLSEYLTAGLPLICGQLPLTYDLDGEWLWRLPGESPWDEQYLAALAELLGTLDRQVIAARARHVQREVPLFDRQMQQRRAEDFVLDLLG